jgi:peptide/nickel transport system permease protein
MAVTTLPFQKKIIAEISLWTRITRLWKRNPVLIIGSIMVFLVILLAIFGPALAPYSPTDQDYTQRLVAPNAAHIFGTDKFGRDNFSRVLTGTQIDLQIGVICVLIPFIIGICVGLVSGYYGGIIDNLLMRIVDISVSFPFYILVIAILAILGRGIYNMYIALIMVGWIAYAKIIRGEVLIVKNTEYVLAARALGYSDGRIIFGHILPNIISPAIIFAMSDVVMCIMEGSALGFLGLGVQAPAPEWGVMIADAREFVSTVPWLPIFPGLAIAIVGISFSMLGDGLTSLLRPTDR